MKTYRINAVLVGVLFIIGTAAGVASVLVTNPILNAPDFPAGLVGNSDRMLVGSLFVLAMGFSLAMVPAVLYPVARRYSPTLAAGYLVFRGALEGAAYFGLVIPWLGLVVLAKGADTSMFLQFASLAEALHVGANQVLIFAFCLGAVILYALLYRSRLVPRWLSIWGIIAIGLHFITGFLLMFGVFDDMSPVITAMNFPIFLQEMVMAVWLIVIGFSPAALQVAATVSERG